MLCKQSFSSEQNTPSGTCVSSQGSSKVLYWAGNSQDVQLDEKIGQPPWQIKPFISIQITTVSVKHATIATWLNSKRLLLQKFIWRPLRKSSKYLTILVWKHYFLTRASRIAGWIGTYNWLSCHHSKWVTMELGVLIKYPCHCLHP